MESELKVIDTVVEVSLDEVIDLDREGFLDLLEELVLSDYDEEERYSYVLEDINYKVVQNCHTGIYIPIEVKANLVRID